MAGVGGDRVPVEVCDGRRPAELAPEPVAERAVDRSVLPPSRHARGAQREPLGSGVEVLRLERQPLPHLAGRLFAPGRAREDLLGLEDLDRGEHLVVRDGAVVDGELQLAAGPDERPISRVSHLG